MSQAFIDSCLQESSFDPNAPLIDTLFDQYEKVIVQSIITSFGLDFFIKDQDGGDVDTILNARKTGFKNDRYTIDKYDSHSYHSHKNYIETNRYYKKLKEDGVLIDAYTGNIFQKNEKINLDHVISAKEIHTDPGRVLSGRRGEDLANSPENLQITNEHTNKTKKADSMEKFHSRRGYEYTDNQKKEMMRLDGEARKSYEHKLFVAYYTSPNFIKDTTIAAGKVGAEMALRQSLGLVFTEIWLSIREEFRKLSTGFDLADFFTAIADGVKRGIVTAKSKFKELFEKFKEGFVAGAISSISTTLCNIFITTAKNTVNIIRQSWASIIEAINILIFNPNNLLFGDRMRAAIKVLAVGASVVAGTMVTEAVSQYGLASIPVIGETLQTFCGVFVTGILSCTMLYFLDRSEYIQRIVDFLNQLPTMDYIVDFYQKQAQRLKEYAAEIEKIDIDSFIRETEKFSDIALCLKVGKSDRDIIIEIEKLYANGTIKKPWKGDFRAFMSNKSNRLVFE